MITKREGDEQQNCFPSGVMVDFFYFYLLCFYYFSSTILFSELLNEPIFFFNHIIKGNDDKNGLYYLHAYEYVYK